ncbi:MAG: RNA polymerase sigma factor [Candidatus Krumholzibacteriota bacterium]|nr:RNA polymerase sigma factor [Candidatus Krumholzibacteriota bacterium]
MIEDRSKESDEEIISQVLNGNVDLYEELIDRYSEIVLGIVSKRIPLDQAEEMAHEVFVRAYRSLQGFNASSPFGNWLSKIAVRTCHDYWRKRYRSKEEPVNSLDPEHREWLDGFMAESARNSFDRAESKKTAREIILWALEKLDPGDRAVLELVHLEGYSVKEAAGILGWSSGKVKIRAFRSRNKLRKMLEKIID